MGHSEELKFLCLAGKHTFKSKKYNVVERNGRFYAVAICPKHGNECWRAMKK